MTELEINLIAVIEMCRSALADIGTSSDMSKAVLQRKAMRVYSETGLAAARALELKP